MVRHSQDTKFTRALVEGCVFGNADLNKDGLLDFEEYVLAVALLGTFSKDQVRCPAVSLCCAHLPSNLSCMVKEKP